MKNFNISGLSNTSNTQKPNFGVMRVEHIQIFDDAKLNSKNINVIKDIAWALNENVAKS